MDGEEERKKKFIELQKYLTLLKSLLNKNGKSDNEQKDKKFQQLIKLLEEGFKPR